MDIKVHNLIRALLIFEYKFSILVLSPYNFIKNQKEQFIFYLVLMTFDVLQKKVT